MVSIGAVSVWGSNRAPDSKVFSNESFLLGIYPVAIAQIRYSDGHYYFVVVLTDEKVGKS